MVVKNDMLSYLSLTKEILRVTILDIFENPGGKSRNSIVTYLLMSGCADGL
ncbi:hypothetical protein ACT9XH_12330 [Methanococcoides methylutens]|uniref:hypothetical protein n=1 Tax=Methanococcoides methylutens TaxID=2226 RepID=UPI00404411FF